jgi:hypothetical protein
MIRTSSAVAATAALVLAASFGVAAHSPIAFKMVASLTDEPLPAFEARDAIDIASIVRAIPDRGVAGTVDTVFAAHPARRYQRSVIEGYGNCSNLVKGLSWGLLRDGHEFEIVYMLPVETFLNGQGHTVLRANLALPEGPRVGLADVAAAAIPRVGERVLDVGDFGGAAVPAVHLDPLRPESEDWTAFYAPDLLAVTAIGRTSSAETARWFRFVEASYLDSGVPEKFEKIVYAGLGVVLGVLPPVHVDDVAALRVRHPYVFAQMIGALWGLRIAPLVLLGCGLYRLVDAVQKRRISASSVVRSSTPIRL